MVDGIATTISHIHGNTAKGTIVNSDLTETPCYIVKEGGYFAHGKTLAEANASLQDKLAAETEQAQKTMEEQAAADRAVISAKAKAEQDVIAANAELEVTKIQAEAALYAGEKEAEMNKRIAESLTPNLVKYYYIKQWEGVLPKTVLGEDNSFMISLE